MLFVPSRFMVSNRILIILGIFLLVLLIIHPVEAANTAGGGLPADKWLVKIQKSVTGPWAFAISIIGIVSAGITLIFGGDISGFLKSAVFLVLVMSILVAAPSFLSTISGKGAEIAVGQNILTEHLKPQLV